MKLLKSVIISYLKAIFSALNIRLKFSCVPLAACMDINSKCKAYLSNFLVRYGETTAIKIKIMIFK
jgi:hypothetical protein